MSEVYLAQVVRQRFGELLRQLRRHTRTTRTELIGVVLIERQYDVRRLGVEPLGESDQIEIVARRISSEHEPGFDSKDLRERGDAKPAAAHFDDLHLERLSSNQLADARLDAVQPAEDQHRWTHPRGHPPVGLLERPHNLLVALPQVCQYVIVVEGNSMRRALRGCTSSNQDSVGDDFLQPGRRCKDILEIGIFLHSTSDYTPYYQKRPRKRRDQLHSLTVTGS